MLLRKTPLSKKLTSEEIEAKLKEVVCSCFLLLDSSEELIWLVYLWVKALIFKNTDVKCSGREKFYITMYVCLYLVNHAEFHTCWLSSTILNYAHFKLENIGIGIGNNTGCFMLVSSLI